MTKALTTTVSHHPSSKRVIQTRKPPLSSATKKRGLARMSFITFITHALGSTRHKTGRSHKTRFPSPNKVTTGP